MPAPLKPLWELRAVAAGAPAAVRVRNLRTTVTGPLDAWGRRGKPQPASISATVTFHDEFGASASTDSVAADTVHYGLLSKAILAAVELPDAAGVPMSGRSLEGLMAGVWAHLTGTDVDVDADVDGHGDGDGGGHGEGRRAEGAFLNLQGIRTMEISMHLPKATLLGDGVSATQMAEFDRAGGVAARARALRVHEMRVPTLIGINANEREAKQVVVASVETDHLGAVRFLDKYRDLAEKIAEIMSNSSFETLEALAKRIGRDLSVLIHGPSFDVHGNLERYTKPDNWRLNISLEKPIAMTLADAVCVELTVWTRQAADAESERLKVEEEARQGERSK